MAGMKSAIDIDRPVDAVCGFFLDLERSFFRTDPTVESVVKTTEGPHGAGTTFRVRQPVMGKVRNRRCGSSPLTQTAGSTWRRSSDRSGPGSA